jgi:hypothetical protein
MCSPQLISTDEEHIYLGNNNFREAVMLEFEVNPHHSESWLDVAAEAKRETDPKKLIELIQTLCEALEKVRLERAAKLPSRSAAA